MRENPVRNFRTGWRGQKYKIKKVWREVWPINWSNLKKFKLISNAITNATYSLKVLITAAGIVFVGSVGIFVFSIYNDLLTKKVGAEGGAIREAVVGSEMNVFNPVLHTESEAEQKINRLLYHPLYEVTYPDFLNTDKEPEIKPILLQEPPSWNDIDNPNPGNRYKELKFILKNDIKWSNGEPITVEDVEYTFKRMQESGANSAFHSLFGSLEFKTISATEFRLISKRQDPQLIYLANFSPISKNYYDSQITERLLRDERSRKPLVTSGYFKFPEGKVADPDNAGGGQVENPIKDDKKGINRAVVLVKNDVDNTGENVNANAYVLKNYDSLLDIGGAESVSLERDAKDGDIHLYTRALAVNLGLEPSEVKNKLTLNQTLTQTNTYYTAYFNTRYAVTSDYVGYLINQTLRNYITCHLVNYDLPERYGEFLEELPDDRKVLPIHFNEEYVPVCGDEQKINSILDSEYYKVDVEERSGIKRVLNSGSEMRLKMIGLSGSRSLLIDLQKYFRDTIGIPVDLVTDSEGVAASLSKNNYNIAVFPVTMVSKDPYPVYGVNKQNYVSLNLNPRIKDYNVEDNLKLYSSSGLVDENAKSNLMDFFSEEFVSVNLFRARNEFNYSSELGNFTEDFNVVTAFLNEVYLELPVWYVETKRAWKWN